MPSATLSARPLPLDLDPAATAVLVVDMQNHFAAPGGSWAISGVDMAPIQALVPAIQTVLARAREAGMPIIYLTTPVPPVPYPLGIPPEAFRGTGRARWELYLDDVAPGRSTVIPGDQPRGWNAEIVDGLAPNPADRVVQKQALSGFYQTELDDVLHQSGITTLLFAGCTTSVCVESTLRDASFRGYDCILLEDCVAEPVGSTLERTNHDATVHLIEISFGWVSDSLSLVQAFESMAASGAPG